MLYAGLQGFAPIKLASAYVTTATIQGQTIHRFLRITNGPNMVNSIRIVEYFHNIPAGKPPCLLVDGVSVVSNHIIESLHTAWVQTHSNSQVNGGVLTIFYFFGDFGQLVSVPTQGQVMNIY